ncbi:hypothetical protein BHE97_05675 [Aeromicrobium sp. PE09-221]|nr:hypothetical protein BHE97_05675 [Aeromicrobium sp. PE09-221]
MRDNGRARLTVVPETAQATRGGDEVSEARPLRTTTPVDPAAGRFELISRIGAGNHGVVFRARDRQLGREVAIKRFSHFLTDDPRAMRRITREVEALARVSHPNVVTVHDLVHLPDGDGEITPHLVMELAEGTSLRDILAAYGPSTRSVLVVRGVLQGLAACHAAGILHLDIKPANVLVTEQGGVKIVDFGIARAASDATATIAGTPHYMAPEQAEGRVDERSDVYSVGCLLYECLTGRPPFEGTMAAQLMAHRHQPRPDPRRFEPGLSPGLSAVVMRAMATEPDHRFGSVTEMLDALVDETVPGAVAAAPGAPVTRNAPPNDIGEPVQPQLPCAGPATVTSWSRMTTFGAGLLASAGVIAAVPTVAAMVGGLAPAEYRPESMTSAAPVWWMAAVTIALVSLLLRRREFFGRLAGPELGSERPAAVLGPSSRSGVRMALTASLRGASIFLFGWYVLGVSALADTLQAGWLSDPFSSPWSIGWVLMPMLAAVLLVRSITRLRPRFGAILMSFLCLCGAAVAALIFLAAPGVVDATLWDGLP